jgi:hypothetical protein
MSVGFDADSAEHDAIIDAERREANARRSLASICETVQRVYMVLEDVSKEAEEGSRLRSELETAVKKLRATIVANT